MRASWRPNRREAAANRHERLVCDALAAHATLLGKWQHTESRIANHSLRRGIFDACFGPSRPIVRGVRAGDVAMTLSFMKRLLVVAFHFPPFAVSSGVQRTLRFIQHLPRFGWEVIVLTCHPRAYEKITSDLERDIPPGTVVERAFALDAARHLAFREKYPGWLARPDRWVSWWPAAVYEGRRMIAKYRPSAILSTYPIATAHLIGDSLSRWGALPWVADFRDPMAQDGYPADPRTWASFKKVEERVFARAAACTFTTRGAANTYRKRYPGSSSRIEVIENGYDQETFDEARRDRVIDAPLAVGVKTLLHSGIVYPDERDPTQLFAALALLSARGVDGQRLRLRFRGAIHEALLIELAQRHRVEHMVEIMPQVPYREALDEMMRADGLLILQAANCNEQVPAKLYEYLRARRPLLALTDPDGDTAAVLRESGSHAVARLDDPHAIANLLARFEGGDFQGMLADESAIARSSRTVRAEQMARLLDEIGDGK